MMLAGCIKQASSHIVQVLIPWKPTCWPQNILNTFIIPNKVNTIINYWNKPLLDTTLTCDQFCVTECSGTSVWTFWIMIHLISLFMTSSVVQASSSLKKIKTSFIQQMKIFYKRHDETFSKLLWSWYKPICHMVATAIKELRDS